MLNKDQIRDRINKHLDNIKKLDVKDKEFDNKLAVLKSRILEAEAIIGISEDEYSEAIA